MKKTIAFISLAAALLSACNKNADVTPQIHYLTAQSADPTKTTLDFSGTPVNVLWSTGDKLAIYSPNSDMYEYVLSSGAESTQGTFAYSGAVDFKSDSDFKAFYPSSMKSAKAANPVWPSVQLRHIYHPEQIDTPMYGEGTLDSERKPSEVKLHNLGGVLKVTASFPSDRGQVYIKTVVVSSTDVISGQFTIDGNKAVPVENGEHFIQLNCEGNSGDGVDCAAGSNHDFVFAVPASDADGYDNFAISFFDNNGKLYAQKHMKKDSENKWLMIEQGKIATLSLTLTAPGAFSVSATKKVIFALGNLTVTSDGQFAIDTDKNGANGFYWSKDATIARTSPYADSGASTSDVLFTNPSITIDGISYSTLTSAEWNYLASRTGLPSGNPGISYGADGITIYPDNSNGTAGTGEVFLPYTQEVSGTKHGFYWTADSYDRNRVQLDASQKTQAVAIDFTTTFNPDSVVPRGSAHAIRLVVDVK